MSILSREMKALLFLLLLRYATIVPKVTGRGPPLPASGKVVEIDDESAESPSPTPSTSETASASESFPWTFGETESRRRRQWYPARIRRRRNAIDDVERNSSESDSSIDGKESLPTTIKYIEGKNSKWFSKDATKPNGWGSPATSPGGWGSLASSTSASFSSDYISSDAQSSMMNENSGNLSSLLGSDSESNSAELSPYDKEKINDYFKKIYKYLLGKKRPKSPAGSDSEDNQPKRRLGGNLVKELGKRKSSSPRGSVEAVGNLQPVHREAEIDRTPINFENASKNLRVNFKCKTPESEEKKRLEKREKKRMEHQDSFGSSWSLEDAADPKRHLKARAGPKVDRSLKAEASPKVDRSLKSKRYASIRRRKM